MTYLRHFSLFLAAVFFILICPVAANGSLTVSDINFYKNDNVIYNTESGDICFKAYIKGIGCARMFIYTYDGNLLSDIKAKTVTVTDLETLYTSSSITISQNGVKPLIYAMVLTDGLAAATRARITPTGYLSPSVKEALLRYDSISDKAIVDFFISLYDPETGGFAVSPSANKTPGFEGELESSATIMIGLPGMGLMSANPTEDPDIPEGFLEKITEFFLSRQSEDDGYFYDPYYGNHMIETKRERSSSKTIEVLKMLNATPRYPTYLDRVAAVTLLSGSTLPGHFATEEKYIEWMASKNWTDNTYLTGNEITNSIDIAIRLGYSDAAAEFILKKQNPKTGLWGVDNITSDSTNGALKLSDALLKLGVKYPYVEQAIDSVIYYIENATSPENICTIWNPLILICNIRSTYKNMFPLDVQTKIDEKVSVLLDKTYSHLIKWRTNDGGYKYYPDIPVAMSGGVDFAPGIDSMGNIEGNYDSTVIGSYLMRNSVYGVAGANPIGAWHQYKAYFWDEIEKKMAHSNRKYVSLEEYTENFENTSMETLDKTWGFVMKNVPGNRSIISENGNKCLKVNTQYISRPEGGTERFTTNFVLPDGDTYTAQFRFKIGSDSTHPALNIFLGAKAVNLCILKDSAIGKSGNKMVLSYRTDANIGISSQSTILKDALEKDTWYSIKIIYTPKGISDTKTEVYLDNEKLLETNEYYNGGFSERLPVKSVQTLKFEGYDRDCTASLYLDDILISVN